MDVTSIKQLQILDQCIKVYNFFDAKLATFFMYILKREINSSLKYCIIILLFLDLFSKDNTSHSLQIRKLTRVTMLSYSQKASTPKTVSKHQFQTQNQLFAKEVLHIYR